MARRLGDLVWRLERLVWDERPLVVAAIVLSVLLSGVAIFVVLVVKSPTTQTVTLAETTAVTTTRTTTVVRTETATVAVSPRRGTVFALPATARANRTVELAWVALRSGSSSERVEVRRGARILETIRTDQARVTAGEVYEVAWRPRRSERRGRLQFCVRARFAGELGPRSCAPLVVRR